VNFVNTKLSVHGKLGIEKKRFGAKTIREYRTKKSDMKPSTAQGATSPTRYSQRTNHKEFVLHLFSCDREVFEFRLSYSPGSAINDL
jgi:hypothetical protein